MKKMGCLPFGGATQQPGWLGGGGLELPLRSGGTPQTTIWAGRSFRRHRGRNAHTPPDFLEICPPPTQFQILSDKGCKWVWPKKEYMVVTKERCVVKGEKISIHGGWRCFPRTVPWARETSLSALATRGTPRVSLGRIDQGGGSRLPGWARLPQPGSFIFGFLSLHFEGKPPKPIK